MIDFGWGMLAGALMALGTALWLVGTFAEPITTVVCS